MDGGGILVTSSCASKLPGASTNGAFHAAKRDAGPRSYSIASFILGSRPRVVQGLSVQVALWKSISGQVGYGGTSDSHS